MFPYKSPRTLGDLYKKDINGIVNYVLNQKNISFVSNLNKENDILTGLKGLTKHSSIKSSDSNNSNNSKKKKRGSKLNGLSDEKILSSVLKRDSFSKKKEFQVTDSQFIKPKDSKEQYKVLEKGKIFSYKKKVYLSNVIKKKCFKQDSSIIESGDKSKLTVTNKRKSPKELVKKSSM